MQIGIYLGTELILEGVEGGGGLGNLSRGEGRSGGNGGGEDNRFPVREVNEKWICQMMY